MREALGRPREYVESATRAGAARLDKAGEMLLDALGFEPADVGAWDIRQGHCGKAAAARRTSSGRHGATDRLPRSHRPAVVSEGRPT